ncbi:MAG: hypothetical protein FJ029_02395 [Actinobacteria bacterium]|nr:hypothetical protein [Actinomycetota bacterium]
MRAAIRCPSFASEQAILRLSQNPQRQVDATRQRTGVIAGEDRAPSLDQAGS